MRAALPTLAFAACLAALPALAQPKQQAPAAAPAAPAAATSNSEARKEAAVLTEMLGTQGSVVGFLNAVRDNMVMQISNSSGKPAATVAASVDQLLMPDLQTHTNELRAAVTDIWVAHFTLQELKDLHAFYLTPLGSKLVKAQPEIAQQTQAFGRSWAEKYAKETGEKHADELRKRGLIN